jgi:hypothetical protein
MGCMNDRIEMHSDEKVIFEFEQELSYTDTDAVRIDYIYRKFSYGNRINESQWENIYNALSLTPHKETNRLADDIEEFYDQFKNHGQYVLESMLVLGIILGAGTGKTKSRLLFEAFDPYNFEVITEKELSRMVDLIFDTFVDKMAAHVTKNKLEGISHHDFYDYVKKLRKGKKGFKVWFLNTHLKENTCTLTDFVSSFSDEEGSRLLNGFYIRQTLIEFSERNPKINSKEIELKPIPKSTENLSNETEFYNIEIEN